MDRPRHNDLLGVNKIGKNIRKSPLHQQNLANGIGSSRPQPQPQVYNISKNDFTSIVQQLRGSPLHESLPQPPPNPQNTRLQKIRPAALKQINRPRLPPLAVSQPAHNLARPPRHTLPHGSQPMMGHGDQCWSNSAESPPVSVYMRYLQNSLGDSRPSGNQMQPSHEHQPQPQVQVQAQPQPPPRVNGSASSMPILPSPRFNGPPQQMYCNSLPSPRFNGRGILPSPYPLQSPGVRYPPPHTPRSSFTSSAMAQPGILGPGKFSQPPAPPGQVLPPPSPFGVLPVSSPRWRGY